jgi:hypothetical protein
MSRKIELLAGYWTITGDCYAMGPSEVSPIPIKERVEAASAAGYTGLGLVHQDLVFNAEAMGYPAMKRLFDDQAYRMLPLKEQAERSFKGAMAQFVNLA